MAGRGGIYRFLILAVAAFAVAGCSPSVEGIVGGTINSTRTPGDLLVYPQKEIFDKDELFYPDEKYLEVYIRYGDGEPQPVRPGEYTIFYIDNTVEPVVRAIVPSTGFGLTASGTRDILVTYNDNYGYYSYRYPITVLSAGNTQSGPISIKWKDR